MTEFQKLLKRELYRRSLYDFVKDFWHTCDPAKFIASDLIEYYCEIFQYMCRSWTGWTDPNPVIPEHDENTIIVDVREDKTKVNINVPPRHCKSMIFNVFGPVWLWLSYPAKAVSISHTGGLAGEMNNKRYLIINSEEFQEIFDDIILVVNTGGKLQDLRGGELRSLNRNAFTGYGGDVIVNDDLTNAETARKDQAEMANAWAYYRNTMPSRINDINKCIIMNIQQRLAPNDITGHIQNDPDLAKQYIFVVIPAIFDQDTIWVYPITGKIVRHKKGDFLWPERFGDYESLKIDVGLAVFETQYLQHPIASDKTIVKPDMIRIEPINNVPSIETADMVYAAHDFPVKDKDTSDFLGSLLSYRVGATLYIKDCLEKKMAFVKGVEYVKQLDDVYPGIIQIIEDKANGAPVLQQLQDVVAGMQAYQPGANSKSTRLELSTVYMTSGNVVFVASYFNKLTQTYTLSPSLQNLYDRLLQFPFVEHDDIVDAFSMTTLFVFMDRRFQVYGRAFNDLNVIDVNTVKQNIRNVFFNKEGNVWKAVEIGIKYSAESKLFINREISFKASMDDGLKKLKEFAPNKSVFIDCSASEALRGTYTKQFSVSRYEVSDYDNSVAQLNLGFAKKRILLDKLCRLTKADIENFKYSKSKDENSARYVSTKDGFCACLRIACKYYGTTF